MIKKGNLPAVGMRIIKSAIGVLLVFLIYFLRGEKGVPFYSALSVLWCLQPCKTTTTSKALQRTVGTFIGAVFGLVMILIDYYLLGGQYEIIRDVLIAIFIIPVIYTTIVFNKKDASYFSCVVFLSIAVNHLTDINPYLFVVNRTVDTLIGIVVAYLLNTIHLPTKKQNDILFVSELEEMLLDQKDSMTPYSKFELNRMLSRGAKFTITTMRPPAGIIPVLKDINMELPVIAMDGAILYDIKKNHVMKKYAMEFEKVYELEALFKKHQFHCFVNVVIEDSIIIYYGDFQHKVEEQIYKKLRSSSYRNYIQKPLLEKGSPVYMMLIDTKERIDTLYAILEKRGYVEQLKVLKYASVDYPGYWYIKIYHKDAYKENMIKELQKMMAVERVMEIVDTKREGYSQLSTRGEDANQIVRSFKRAYEYPIWMNRD